MCVKTNSNVVLRTNQYSGPNSLFLTRTHNLFYNVDFSVWHRHYSCPSISKAEQTDVTTYVAGLNSEVLYAMVDVYIRTFCRHVWMITWKKKKKKKKKPK